MTGLVMTKLDVLSGLDEIRVAVRYRGNEGATFEQFPYHQSVLHHAAAEYETLPGWREDIGGARSEDDLPDAAREYLRYIEEFVRVPIKLGRRRPRPRPGDLGRRARLRGRARGLRGDASQAGQGGSDRASQRRFGLSDHGVSDGRDGEAPLQAGRHPRRRCWPAFVAGQTLRAYLGGDRLRRARRSRGSRRRLARARRLGGLDGGDLRSGARRRSSAGAPRASSARPASGPAKTRRRRRLRRGPSEAHAERAGRRPRSPTDLSRRPAGDGQAHVQRVPDRQRHRLGGRAHLLRGALGLSGPARARLAARPLRPAARRRPTRCWRSSATSASSPPSTPSASRSRT